jgi:cytochrome c oxidase subunit 4
MTHALPSPLRYVAVWIALLALTAVSVSLSFVLRGSTDIAVTLVIASIKMLLVVIFFMHLAEERFSVVMIPCVAVFFIVLLLGLTAVDVATRHTFPSAPSLNVGELPAVAD